MEGATIYQATSERILGHRVDVVDMSTAVREVISRSMQREPGAYVCLTNVHTTVEAHRSPELRAAAQHSFLSVADGMPLVWILKKRGHRKSEKVTGIDYVPLISRAGLEPGLRHYFYGGAPGVAETATEALRRLIPGVQIVGASAPPFGPMEEWDLNGLRAELDDARPDIMWVGLGAPKQEIWMHRVAGDLDVPMMVGVGACFDFLARTKRTAPRVVSRMGLEWLFRLASEPRRLAKRYIIGNSEFVYRLARESVRKKAADRP